VQITWDTYNKRLNDLLGKLTNEQLMAETAPGRNSGIYLLGHLAAVSDDVFTFLDAGPRLFAELDYAFIDNPDKAVLKTHTIPELKAALVKINATLDAHIAGMLPEEWFTKHSAVSAEAFAKEPYRNKLNIMINRTNHLSYHLGQLAYLANPTL
jgi:hypothetical protein